MPSSAASHTSWLAATASQPRRSARIRSRQSACASPGRQTSLPLRLEPVLRTSSGVVRFMTGRFGGSPAQGCIPAPVFADTANTSIPSRPRLNVAGFHLGRVEFDQPRPNPPFAITTRSAVLKIVGYLSGLSSPSVTERDDDPQQASLEIERRRADEISSVVFEKEEAEVREFPTFQRPGNHVRFQMAHGPGGNLPDPCRQWRAESPGVVVRCQVTDQAAATRLNRPLRQHPFEESGFTFQRRDWKRG